MAMDEDAKKEFAELLAHGVKEGIKALRSEDEEFAAKNGGQGNQGEGNNSGTSGGSNSGTGKPARYGLLDFLMGG